MPDSLTSIIQSLQKNQDGAFDIIQKVDSFYNNAWTKLIFVITIGFTIVGIIVPFIIQRIQNNALKASEALLKKEIADKIKEIKEEISTELIAKMDEKFRSYEKEIRITRASANAKLFLAEGRVKLGMDYYDRALSDFISAAFNCIESENYPTLSDSLKLIANDCLPYLSLEEINDLKTRNYCDLNFFLDELTKMDEKYFFRETIGEIKVIISKLPKTITDKPEEKSKKPQT